MTNKTKTVSKRELNNMKLRLKLSWEAENMIAAYRDKKVQLMAMATKVTTTLSATPKSVGPGDKIANAATEIATLDNSINQEIIKYTNAIKATKELIDLVKDQQLKVLLTRRYINRERWEYIATQLSYSWVHMHRLHNKALVRLIVRLRPRKKME